MQAISKTIGILILIILSAYTWAFVRVFAFSRTDQLSPGLDADVIVVLGAAQWNGVPSPVFRGRLDHAVALYNAGYADALLFTGGKRPGDRFTEAEAAFRYTRAQGLPATSVFLENKGRTSWESMAALRRIMAHNGWTTAILVSDPFHMLRLKSMAHDLGIQAYSSPTTVSAIRATEWLYLLGEARVYLAYELGYRT